MRVHVTALMLLALVAASAAQAVTIAELVASTEAYDGTSVTVVGTVVQVLPVGAESGFDLGDGPARVTVVSRSAAPISGARLEVTGTVHVFHEGDEDDKEANRFPPLIAETARRPAP